MSIVTLALFVSMMMNIFKSKYTGIEYGIEYCKCKDYLADGSKLQKIANVNDDDSINDHESCTQYCQESHKQYDLLSLFIRDKIVLILLFDW